MANTPTVALSILGKDYQVACPTEKRDALVRAARELDKRMRTIRDSGSVIGLERIAVMAALNLNYELLQAAPKEDDRDEEQALRRIADKLDKVLP